MQVVRNSMILLILLPLVIMFFMPKKELYYMLEKRLSEKNIVISNEEIEEGILSLTIKHPVVYFGGAEVATVESVTFWSILLYSSVDLKNILITEGLPTELSVQDLSMVHSVLSPMQIVMTGKGSLGLIEGKITLAKKKIRVNVTKGGEKRAFKKYLKKSEKGWYYESTF